MTKLPKPMKRAGVTTRRWAVYRERSRVLVMQRCLKRGRLYCEGCGKEAESLEWAHLASRGNVVAEPIASSPELTAGLHRVCHERIDRHIDPKMLNTLRWSAASMLASKFRLSPEYWAWSNQMDTQGIVADPLDLIRHLVRLIENQPREVAG